MSFRSRNASRRTISIKTFYGLVIAAAFLLAWVIYLRCGIDVAGLELYCRSHPVVSVCVFLLTFPVCVFFSIPSLPLNIAAGYLWGTILGGIYTSLGATFGSLCAFSLARYLFGQPLTAKMNRKWLEIAQREFKSNGWKFLAIARLNPIIPTGPLNYILAFTSISTRTFIVVTFLSLLIPALIAAAAGANLAGVLDQSSLRSSLSRLGLILSLLFTALSLAGFLAQRYAMRLKSAVDAQQNQCSPVCSDNA